MSSIVIVGAQWGDEGKGKIVDVLTEKANWVVRFQGGNNAGHTIVIDGVKTALSLLPSGILRPNVQCLLGAGVVLNPTVLLSEMDRVRSAGAVITPGRLVIDRDAHLVLDYHILVDKARELLRGADKIGTTGRGIGPAYEDRSQRSGIRCADLLNPNKMRERVRAHVDEKNKLLKYVLDSKAYVDFDVLWERLSQEAEILAPFVGCGSRIIFEALRRDEKVIFEGAQGVLLDQVHGTYPFVTSSSTIAGAATIGTGIGPKMIDSVIGIAKAYCTRVGEGPFPSEIDGLLGDDIRKRGHEFGTVTGRPRRCGWFDAVAMKRAIRTSGIDSLVLTKLDVLSGLPTVKVCVGYEVNGEPVDDLPASLEGYEGLIPVYVELPGWSEDISAVRSLRDLPANVQSFLEMLSARIECPISFASVGPGREATIPVEVSDVLRAFLP